jgi:hypothetical protein
MDVVVWLRSLGLGKYEAQQNGLSARPALLKNEATRS